MEERADNRTRGIENRVDDCVSGLNNLSKSQSSLKTEVSSISIKLDGEEKCQSGRGVGCYSYPETVFPCTTTVKFNPPFRNVPALVYGFHQLDSSTVTRYTSELLQLSKESFTLHIKTWSDSILWGVRINWMACPK